MRLIGYARTSTEEQVAGLGAQIHDLTAAGCEIIYNEQVSSVGERPEFDAALAELRPGDRLVVCKVDRLARSTVGLWKIVERLDVMDCGLRILNLGGDVVDTKSATGKLILTIFAGFAQFEREMMLERQRPGIAKALAEGKYRGRKPKLHVKSPEVLEMHRAGRKITHIARNTGMSTKSVYRILEDQGVPYARVVARNNPHRVSRRMAAPQEIRAES